MRARTRYVWRSLPLAVLIVLVTGLVIAGFVSFLVQEHFRLAVAESSVVSVQSWVLVGLLMVIMMGVLALGSLRGLVRSFRVHHELQGTMLRFVRGWRSWAVDLADLQGLVVGEDKVMACRSAEEIARALDFLARPFAFRVLTQPLDGVHYLATDVLLADLRAAGFALEQEDVAVVVRVRP